MRKKPSPAPQRRRTTWFGDSKHSPLASLAADRKTIDVSPVPTYVIIICAARMWDGLAYRGCRHSEQDADSQLLEIPRSVKENIFLCQIHPSLFPSLYRESSIA